MRRFLKRIVLFIVAYAMVLLALYVITDPFKTLRPFSFHYYNDEVRDYCTSEVFLRNNPMYHFDSFIIGSSRGMGFSTYHWKQYLPPGSRPFLFQAWHENLEGIEQKLDYVDQNGNEINNVLVLLDIPGSFCKIRWTQDVVLIKHYRFSGQSKLAFHACLFYGFMQKPSKWYASLKQFLFPEPCVYHSDTVTNDWEASNKLIVSSRQPAKDSLLLWTEKNRNAYLKQIEGMTDANLHTSEPLIDDEYLSRLKHIKAILDRHGTDYRIVVTPAYCYTHSEINPLDLAKLRAVFGEDRVFDYSGKNEITVDCYNFSDAEHFGLSVGWQMIEEIYHK